jgi:tetratricopeptide (TPR) repeat protein
MKEALPNLSHKETRMSPAGALCAALLLHSLNKNRKASFSWKKFQKYGCIKLCVLLCLVSAPLVSMGQSVQNYERLERAAERIRQGQLTGAEAELNAVLRQAPREANALNLLGVIRAQQRRTGEAEQLFLRALNAKPTLLGAFVNLGQLYLELQKADRALWAFTEASKLAPDNAEINFNLASLYEGKSEYGRALEYLGKIPSSQMSTDHLYLLIKSHLGLGNTREALGLAEPLKQRGTVPSDMAASFAALFAEHKLFDEAIQILEVAKEDGKPSFALLYNLGTSYYQKGERARAEESYLAALALQPDDVPTLRALAGLARAGGNLEKSLSYLVRARKIAPDSPAVLYDFGWTALNMNLLYDALSVLERLHKMQPDHHGYLYALAIARLHNGEAPRAQALIKRYIELRPQDGRGYYILGATLYVLRIFPEARTALERSLALVYYPDAEYYLGLIAHGEGDESQAIAWLQRALKSDPTNSAAYAALGTVYAKEKDYKSARSALERAIELDPKDVTAHYQLGLVYARLGDKERAEAMFALNKKLRDEQQKSEIVGFRLIDPPK